MIEQVAMGNYHGRDRPMVGIMCVCTLVIMCSIHMYGRLGNYTFGASFGMGQ